MSNETETAVEIKKDDKRAAKTEEQTDLDTLIKYQKRLLGQSRIRTLACVVIAAIFVLAALLIGPRLNSTLDDLQTSMANLNELTKQLPGVVTEVQVLVEQGQVGISQAILAVDGALVAVDKSMNELASLDIASLNAAIQDFAKVSKGLAESPLIKMLS